MENILDLRPIRGIGAQQHKGASAASKLRPADKFLRTQTIEKLTLQIDHLLDDKARNESMPEAVAMAARTLCCNATVPPNMAEHRH